MGHSAAKHEEQDDGKKPIYIGNIGAGDFNTDWLKVIAGGKYQRQDLAASHMNMVRYYTEKGEAAKAQHEQKLLDILTSAGEGETTLVEHCDIMIRYFEAEGDAYGAERMRKMRAHLLEEATNA